MKKMLCIALLATAITACTYDPIPPHIQKKVDAIPADQLPRHRMAERDLCGVRKTEENLACYERVRRESLAREMAREERNSQ